MSFDTMLWWERKTQLDLYTVLHFNTPLVALLEAHFLEWIIVLSPIFWVQGSQVPRRPKLDTC